MSTDFQMNYHHNKDNLHVKMQGIFDGNSAHELLNLFLREYRCGGRVFGGGKRSVAVRQQGVAGPVVPDARSGVAAVLQGRKRIQHGALREPCAYRAAPQEEKRVLRKMRALHMPRRTRAWARARRMRMSRRTQSRSLTFFQVELFHE